MRIDFQTLAANLPNVASAPRLAHVVQRALQDQQARAGETQGSHSLREAIRGAAPGDARTMIESFLRKELAKILGTSPGKVDLEQPLTLVGIDSLMAVELEARFEAELGVAMPRGSLLGPEVTARQLGERLLHELLSDNLRAATPPEAHAEKTFGVALA
jgi:acyl carrier protein